MSDDRVERPDGTPGPEPPTSGPPSQIPRPPGYADITPELEWSEVVPGARPGERVLRVVRPHARHFRRAHIRHLVATERPATPPPGPLGLIPWLRGLLIGPPIAAVQLQYERMSKLRGLGIFGSDALSSSAYAVENALLILMLAGTAGLGYGLPIAAAIAVLLAIVVISYREMIRAYPEGGGVYLVTRDQFGTWPALAAASALLVGYALTVAVSISAGVAALTSAWPGLQDSQPELAVGLILLIVLVNLWTGRESATVFALPTYVFLAAMFLLIGVGLEKWLTGQLPPAVGPAGLVSAVEPLTLLLLIRAFAGGSAALTGTETIADGAGAFKEPSGKNAGACLTWTGAILALLVLGLAFLAQRLAIVPRLEETVISQLARATFGTGGLYYALQIATMLVLVLAANAALVAFPRLAYFLARDRFLPHQFQFRGERLASAGGTVSLALLAGLLVVIFAADTHALLALYVVPVFLAFSVSLASMVRHGSRQRGPGWGVGLVVNAVGAVATGIVAVVIATTRFGQGVWIVLVLIALLMLLQFGVRRHYRKVAERLRLRPGEQLPQPHEQPVLVPISALHRGVVGALAYARSISSNVAAVFVTDDLEEAKKLSEEWERWECGIPLVILESPYRALVGPLLAYIDALDKQDPEAPITVVLPEFVPKHWWASLLHNQDALRIKLALFFRPNTVVIDVPYHLEH